MRGSININMFELEQNKCRASPGVPRGPGPGVVPVGALASPLGVIPHTLHLGLIITFPAEAVSC